MIHVLVHNRTNSEPTMDFRSLAQGHCSSSSSTELMIYLQGGHNKYEGFEGGKSTDSPSPFLFYWYVQLFQALWMTSMTSGTDLFFLVIFGTAWWLICSFVIYFIFVKVGRDRWWWRWRKGLIKVRLEETDGRRLHLPTLSLLFFFYRLWLLICRSGVR